MRALTVRPWTLRSGPGIGEARARGRARGRARLAGQWAAAELLKLELEIQLEVNSKFHICDRDAAMIKSPGAGGPTARPLGWEDKPARGPGGLSLPVRLTLALPVADSESDPNHGPGPGHWHRDSLRLRPGALAPRGRSAGHAGPT